jgi:hypothetical protein
MPPDEIRRFDGIVQNRGGFFVEESVELGEAMYE